MKGFIIFVLIVIVVMAGTNPQSEDFKIFAERELQRSVAGDSFIGKLFSKVVSAASGLVTEREDYFLFSVYTVDLGRYEVKYIGVFRNFFVIKE